MSLRKVEQLRADRGFKIWDIAVYAALVIVILALFAVFVFPKKNTPLTSIKITKGFGLEPVTVCTYSFVLDSLEVAEPEVITVEENTAALIRLTFHGDGEGEYNTIVIDKSAVSVKVTSANCPALNCVYTAAITSNASSPIICSTHQMIIQTDYVSGSVIQ